ncbi:MAG: YggT family protein [Burkholderiales bacterium]|jgi:YggT family protein|nr:YggT family protein [Burkholderiales bacterium]MCA3162197.1 YggT family protein [Burkholderiales bacterium]MCA3164050.1 YggT family protein [Burkholderiales bacterium]MCA3165555.1 YggT family protein [Burkholderiales bacterium]MCA3171168.1 YggT family protein [Burkholderiales bacterium]
MLSDIIHLIAETIGGLFASALLLRAYMQWLRLSPRNPLSEFVMALTNRIVLPLRRLIPGFGGIDWASLVAAYLTTLATLMLILVAGGAWNSALATPMVVLGLSLVWLVKWTLYLVIVLTLLYAVLSWLNPYAPIAPVLSVLVNPLLSPLQRILPRIGNIDLSPLVLLLLVQILLLLLDRASRATLGAY